MSFLFHVIFLVDSFVSTSFFGIIFYQLLVKKQRSSGNSWEKQSKHEKCKTANFKAYDT